MKCQYISFAGIEEAKAEKLKINDADDSRVLYECLTCYACQEYCPYDNNPFYLLVERQEELGILPAPKPIVEEQLRMMAPKGRIEKQAVSGVVVDMCAFPMLTGCIRGKLFEGATTITGTDIFCNIMWLHFAKNSTIRERVPRIIDNIMHFYLKDSKTSELICFHDECYGTYTSVADAFGIDVPFTPIHQFDYIAGRLNELQDRIKPLNIKIAYQRPCSNRLASRTDKMLDEIFEKIGADRVPRTYDRENALCCGGGGGNFFTDLLSGRADTSARARVREAAAAGAQMLAVACLLCAIMLEDAIKTENLDNTLCVREISEIGMERIDFQTP